MNEIVERRTGYGPFVLFVKFTRSFNQWQWVRALVAQQSAYWPIPLIVSSERNYVCALPIADPASGRVIITHRPQRPHLLRFFTLYTDASRF